MPQPDVEGDKEERGRVLVVGGAGEMPGAVILAANAALRAGAGKIQIGTCRSISQTVAAAVPEARIFGLPETRTGAISVSAAKAIAERAKDVQSVLIGPGMIDEGAVARLVGKLLQRIEGATLILDAAALGCFKRAPKCLRDLKCQAVLTPNAAEMANILGVTKGEIEKDPQTTALRAAENLGAVVALKGAETFIVGADVLEVYCNRAGNVGLAISGSGDTLSGIIAGLAARGAPPLQAAVWGVHLHGRAGDALAQRMGRLGYLAREIPAEVPRLMSELDRLKRR
ncbi:MAG TPA: NAD(P)H-hydrate dehydratase [Pyrinomonadaceae bacterium]